MSNDVAWAVTRNSSRFLLKKRNCPKPFSTDPMNLTNLHSQRYSGICNSKAVGVMPAKAGFQVRNGFLFSWCLPSFLPFTELSVLFFLRKYLTSNILCQNSLQVFPIKRRKIEVFCWVLLTNTNVPRLCFTNQRICNQNLCKIMLFPLKMALFLREIASFYTNFNYKFYNLWSKVEEHKTWGKCLKTLADFN